MSDLAVSSGMYPARPRLFIEGTEEVGLAQGVTSMLIEETVEGLYRCEIAMGNWGNAGDGLDFLYFDRETLEFGKELEIRIGDGDSQATVFKGPITGIEGSFPQSAPPSIAVLAEDQLQNLRMTRRTRAFEDVTDADLVEQIGGEHGLQVDTDMDGPSYSQLGQLNQSDLAFLRERARCADAELWIDDGTLHCQARSRRQVAEVELTYGQRLIEFSVLADLAGQCTSLSVSGWDLDAKQGIDVSAEVSSLGSELGGDQQGGGAILEQAFGQRAQRIVHLTPADEEQARTMAEAHYRRDARRFLTGSGVAEGDGRIRVGTRLTLNGLGPLFSGIYYCCEVRHRFDDARGLRTAFRVERAGIGQ